MSTMVKARFANSVCQRDLGFGVKKSAVGIYEGNAETGLRVGGGSSEVFAADPVAVVFLRIPFASCKIW